MADLRQAVECEMYEEWLAGGGCDSRGVPNSALGVEAWVCPPFELVAGFPPRPVHHVDGVTLRAHEPPLLGAAVTQRMQATRTGTD